MNNEILIKFWDVKHGHATYIKTPTGKHIIIDLGSGSYDTGDEFSPLIHLKNNYDVEQIDYCVITHPHMDHIDDILNWDDVSPKVLCRPKNIDLDTMLNNVREKDREKLEKYIEINNNYNTPVSSNESIDNDEYYGAKIKVFGSSLGQSNINNFSKVFVIEYEGLKAVIPGDNEKTSWEELLENQSFKDSVKNADIYLASHHGRESGFHKDIMELINPLLVIISDSKYQSTSCREKYTEVAQGWNVFKKDGSKIKRYTLSTYNDGVITVKLGKGESNNYVNVTLGK